jgi:hypothetical protein
MVGSIVALAAILTLGRPQAPASAPAPVAEVAELDPANVAYVIEGRTVTLKNGMAEEEAAPGSASKIVTKIWDQPVMSDFDRDGKEDAAVVLTQSPGGSGTFYYVAVALSNGGHPKGTNAVLLGDRIAPQTMTADDAGTIVMNYATRPAGAPVTARNSVGVSTYMKVENGTLVVVQ